MRYFEYVESTREDKVRRVILSEESILQRYYPLWIYKMKKGGKEHLISPDNCIRDFITIHYAQYIGDF
jgi:hypothetical protein